MSKAKTKAKGPSIFIPLRKVDEEQRLVYGTITAEEMDRAGEVMDYASSKPNFESWSAGIEEASNGLSKGNLRIMHGLKVGGKLTDIAYNDDEQSIEVCAKVTDEVEWNNVLEGCYTGFSVGGSYAKRWNEIINGQTVKKYTANPNEVSLVDNPCVKSATFQLIKADGSVVDVDLPLVEDPSVGELPSAEVPEPAATTETQMEPTNEEVAAKASEIALQKADGSTWMDHIQSAREVLMKASKPDDTKKPKKEGEDNQDTEEPNKDKETGKDAGTDDKSQKAAGASDVADRLSQVWKTSDGESFTKKADAVAHEEELQKAANLTEIEKLRQRLAKAVENPTVLEVPLLEDYQRTGDVINALLTPFENGEPVLEKGMYTVSNFARALWDLGNIAVAIKREGAKEGGDESDSKVWSEIGVSLSALGTSLSSYLADQLTELLAGINDDEMACVYDYYYRAAQDNSENALAKDVCSAIETYKDPSREVRETLAKAFGMTETGAPPAVDSDLQKRFDDLSAQVVKAEATVEEMKKVAVEAIEQVETLSKRMAVVEETPINRPPANPGNIAWREGDERHYLGKSFTSEGELTAHLHNLIKTKGPDALAVELIKASQAGGGMKMLPSG